MSGLPAPFGDYYREIYTRGMLANEQPTMPVSWSELERAAEEHSEIDLTSAAGVPQLAGGVSPRNHQ